MAVDTNLTLGKSLTFSGAMRLNWFVLSSAFKIAGAFTTGWLLGGVTVSSTATLRKIDSDDIGSVEKLEITYKNVTVTWVKRSVT